MYIIKKTLLIAIQTRFARCYNSTPLSDSVQLFRSEFGRFSVRSILFSFFTSALIHIYIYAHMPFERREPFCRTCCTAGGHLQITRYTSRPCVTIHIIIFVRRNYTRTRTSDRDVFSSSPALHRNCSPFRNDSKRKNSNDRAQDI